MLEHDQIQTSEGYMLDQELARRGVSDNRLKSLCRRKWEIEFEEERGWRETAKIAEDGWIWNQLWVHYSRLRENERTWLLSNSSDRFAVVDQHHLQVSAEGEQNRVRSRLIHYLLARKSCRIPDPPDEYHERILGDFVHDYNLFAPFIPCEPIGPGEEGIVRKLGGREDRTLKSWLGLWQQALKKWQRTSKDQRLPQLLTFLQFGTPIPHQNHLDSYRDTVSEFLKGLIENENPDSLDIDAKLIDALHFEQGVISFTEDRPEDILQKFLGSDLLVFSRELKILNSKASNQRFIWLSSARDDTVEVIGPSDLEMMYRECRAFAQSQEEETTIILDGIEYLITNSGFDPVLKVTQSLRDLAATQNTCVVVRLVPGALDPRETALLLSEGVMVQRSRLRTG